MAQHGDPGVDAQLLVDALADVHGAARALGHHHHIVGGAGQAGLTYLLHHVPVKVHGPLGDEHRRGTHGDAHIQGQITGAAAHDLHHRAALVGLHGVPQLIHTLDGRVAGGVKADGIVGAADVVVDGGGDAHHLKGLPLLGQLAGQGQGPPEGAVAADGHDALQPQQLAGGDGLLPALRRHKLLAAGGIQHGAALVDNMADAVAVHADKVVVDETVPAPADADALNAPVHRRAHHCPHRRVHAGGVAAAGQYADPFHLVAHVQRPSFYALCNRYA